MTTTTRKARKAHQAARRAESAAVRYAALQADFNSKLARLAEAAKSNPRLNVATPSWGDVGDLAHYNELLSSLTDCLFGEGEYAEGGK